MKSLTNVLVILITGAYTELMMEKKNDGWPEYDISFFFAEGIAKPIRAAQKVARFVIGVLNPFPETGYPSDHEVSHD